MKENLVQKLDILNAQLALAKNKYSDDSVKLSRTKYIIEKHSKSEKEIPPVDQLERQIEETVNEILKRKLHYALTIIKRFLKQFKKVEPLKIAKRRKSADTDEKKATLDAEENFVKNMDIEQWANDIVFRYLSKKLDVSSVFNIVFNKKQLSSVESNVYGRIGKANAVRDAQNQLLEAITPYVSENLIEKDVKATDNKDVNEKHTEKESQSKEKKQPATTSEKDDFTEFNEEVEKEEEEESNKERSFDPFFDQQVDISESEEEPDTIGVPPTLMQGYISGSDDDEDNYSVPDPKPVRRNRRGQRARQKIWEQKYGSKANHILKKQKEEEKLKREKELKRKRREEKIAQFKRKKQEFEAKPLHPSWEAKQKQKMAQEKVKFEGKKVKF